MDARIGIGLRAPHIQEVLDSRPALGWLEVHSENWMTDSGPIADRLQEIRDAYPLSLHGVGLSLGSADGVDSTHLQKLARLVARCQPILVSEHLAWSRLGAHHSNDLLPLPFTPEAVRILADNIDRVQQCLGRSILVENISAYCTFSESVMPEWAFVRAVVERADCGLLLDLNNIYVNACNHGFASEDYLDAMPWSRVAEVHLAGFEVEGDALIDTHGRVVQEPVWTLYQSALQRLPVSARTLIEWDTDLPPLSRLLDEARKASGYLKAVHDAAA
jgi:uncharacterized protein (UPF0276 family)